MPLTMDSGTVSMAVVDTAADSLIVDALMGPFGRMLEGPRR